MWGNDVLNHLVHPISLRNGAFNRDQIPVDPKNDGTANFYVNVRSAALYGSPQNTLKELHLKCWGRA
jgi:hypothetical protein